MSSSAGYVFDPIYLEHDVPGHPERPDRLRAIMSLLEESGLLTRMQPIAPRDAREHELRLVHDPRLIEHVRRAASETESSHWLDSDTYVVPRSFEVAVRAAGGVVAAVDAVVDGELGSAFCLVRPPGHHATPVRAMGFCLFNNVAIAAAHAVLGRGVERVAVVDFDVHHGNGTQDRFYGEPNVLYFSTHQWPFYPGTGDWRERGAGNIVNIPLPAGCGDAEYLRCYGEVCAPMLRRFRPQLLLVSAGFDAHFADPLANMLVSTKGYFEIASLLRDLAAELCEGRIIYVLEGGYDATSLSWSVRSCIDSLLGNDFAPDPLGPGPAIQAPDIERLLQSIKRVCRL